MKLMNKANKKPTNDIFSRYPCPNCKDEYLSYTLADISNEELLSKYGFRREAANQVFKIVLAYCTNKECNALTIGYLDADNNVRSNATIESVTDVFLDNILKIQEHKEASDCIHPGKNNYNHIILLSKFGFKPRENNNVLRGILNYCTDCNIIISGNITENDTIFNEEINGINKTFLERLLSNFFIEIP